MKTYSKEEAIKLMKQGAKMKCKHWRKTCDDHLAYVKGKLKYYDDRSGYEDVYMAMDYDNGYYIIEEGKKVEKDLREMLKTGVIVTYRNGEEGIVFVGASFDNDKIINLHDGCYTKLESVNADLSADWGDEGYDIVKIENYDDLSDTWRALGKNVEQSWHTPVRKVVWMRESEEAVKLKEVIAQLEKDLKDAQYKLKSI